MSKIYLWAFSGNMTFLVAVVATTASSASTASTTTETSFKINNKKIWLNIEKSQQGRQILTGAEGEGGVNWCTSKNQNSSQCLGIHYEMKNNVNTLFRNKRLMLD